MASPSTSRNTLRVRNAAEGVVYHLVFEGNVGKLTGSQLKAHLAGISQVPAAQQHLRFNQRDFRDDMTGAQAGLTNGCLLVMDTSATPQPPASGTQPSNRSSPDSPRLSTNPAPGSAPQEMPGTRHAAHATSVPPSAESAAIPVGNPTYPVTSVASSLPPAPPPPPFASTRDGSAARRVAPTHLEDYPAATNTPQGTAELAGDSHPYGGGGGPSWAQGYQSTHYAAFAAPSASHANPLAAYYPYGHTGAPNNTSSTVNAQSSTLLQNTTFPQLPTAGESGFQSEHSPLPRSTLRPPPTSRQAPQPFDGTAGGAYHASPSAYGTQYEVHTPATSIPVSSLGVSARPIVPPASSPAWAGTRQSVGLNHSTPFTAPPAWQQRVQAAAAAPPASYAPYNNARNGAGGAGANVGTRGPYEDIVDQPAEESTLLDTPGTQDYDQRVASVLTGPTTAQQAALSADALTELLTERDYVWSMEQQRFRTERENRLRELQIKERELAFNAARIDRERALLALRTEQERSKLSDLQRLLATDVVIDEQIRSRAVSEASYAGGAGGNRYSTLLNRSVDSVMGGRGGAGLGVDDGLGVYRETASSLRAGEDLYAPYADQFGAGVSRGEAVDMREASPRSGIDIDGDGGGVPFYRTDREEYRYTASGPSLMSVGGGGGAGRVAAPSSPATSHASASPAVYGYANRVSGGSGVPSYDGVATRGGQMGYPGGTDVTMEEEVIEVPSVF